jgi:hypothetical protein
MEEDFIGALWASHSAEISKKATEEQFTNAMTDPALASSFYEKYKDLPFGKEGALLSEKATPEQFLNAVKLSFEQGGANKNFPDVGKPQTASGLPKEKQTQLGLDEMEDINTMAAQMAAQLAGNIEVKSQQAEGGPTSWETVGKVFTGEFLRNNFNAGLVSGQIGNLNEISTNLTFGEENLDPEYFEKFSSLLAQQSKIGQELERGKIKERTAGRFFSDAVGSLISSPVGMFTEMFSDAGGMAQAGAGVAGAAFTGGISLGIAMGLSGADVEAGSIMSEKIRKYGQENGFNPETPEGLRNIYKNKEFIKESKRLAALGGAIVGAAEAISGGLMGQVGKTGARIARATDVGYNFGGRIAVGAAMDGTGEFTKSMAVYGKADAWEVGLEMAGGPMQSSIMAYFETKADVATLRKNQASDVYIESVRDGAIRHRPGDVVNPNNSLSQGANTTPAEEAANLKAAQEAAELDMGGPAEDALTGQQGAPEQAPQQSVEGGNAAPTPAEGTEQQGATPAEGAEQQGATPEGVPLPEYTPAEVEDRAQPLRETRNAVREMAIEDQLDQQAANSLPIMEQMAEKGYISLESKEAYAELNRDIVEYIGMLPDDLRNSKDAKDQAVVREAVQSFMDRATLEQEIYMAEQKVKKTDPNMSKKERKLLEKRKADLEKVNKSLESLSKDNSITLADYDKTSVVLREAQNRIKSNRRPPRFTTTIRGEKVTINDNEYFEQIEAGVNVFNERNANMPGFKPLEIVSSSPERVVNARIKRANLEQDIQATNADEFGTTYTTGAGEVLVNNDEINLSESFQEADPDVQASAINKLMQADPANPNNRVVRSEGLSEATTSALDSMVDRGVATFDVNEGYVIKSLPTRKAERKGERAAVAEENLQRTSVEAARNVKIKGAALKKQVADIRKRLSSPPQIVVQTSEQYATSSSLAGQQGSDAFVLNADSDNPVIYVDGGNATTRLVPHEVAHVLIAQELGDNKDVLVVEMVEQLEIILESGTIRDKALLKSMREFVQQYKDRGMTDKSALAEEFLSELSAFLSVNSERIQRVNTLPQQIANAIIRTIRKLVPSAFSNQTIALASVNETIDFVNGLADTLSGEFISEGAMSSQAAEQRLAEIVAEGKVIEKAIIKAEKEASVKAERDAKALAKEKEKQEKAKKVAEEKAKKVLEKEKEKARKGLSEEQRKIEEAKEKAEADRKKVKKDEEARIAKLATAEQAKAKKALAKKLKDQEKAAAIQEKAEKAALVKKAKAQEAESKRKAEEVKQKAKEEAAASQKESQDKRKKEADELRAKALEVKRREESLRAEAERIRQESVENEVAQTNTITNPTPKKATPKTLTRKRKPKSGDTVVYSERTMTMFTPNKAITPEGDVIENVTESSEYEGIQVDTPPETVSRTPAVGESFMYDGERYLATKVDGVQLYGTNQERAGAFVKGVSSREREFGGTVKSSLGGDQDFQQRQDRELAKQVVNDDLMSDQEKRDELREYGLSAYEYLLDENNQNNPLGQFDDDALNSTRTAAEIVDGYLFRDGQKVKTDKTTMQEDRDIAGGGLLSQKEGGVMGAAAQLAEAHRQGYRDRPGDIGGATMDIVTQLINGDGINEGQYRALEEAYMNIKINLDRNSEAQYNQNKELNPNRSKLLMEQEDLHHKLLLYQDAMRRAGTISGRILQAKSMVVDFEADAKAFELEYKKYSTPELTENLKKSLEEVKRRQRQRADVQAARESAYNDAHEARASESITEIKQDIASGKKKPKGAVAKLISWYNRLFALDTKASLSERAKAIMTAHSTKSEWSMGQYYTNIYDTAVEVIAEQNLSTLEQVVVFMNERIKDRTKGTSAPVISVSREEVRVALELGSQRARKARQASLVRKIAKLQELAEKTEELMEIQSALINKTTRGSDALTSFKTAIDNYVIKYMDNGFGIPVVGTTAAALKMLHGLVHEYDSVLNPQNTLDDAAIAEMNDMFSRIATALKAQDPDGNITTKEAQDLVLKDIEREASGDITDTTILGLTPTERERYKAGTAAQVKAMRMADTELIMALSQMQKAKSAFEVKKRRAEAKGTREKVAAFLDGKTGLFWEIPRQVIFSVDASFILMQAGLNVIGYLPQTAFDYALLKAQGKDTSAVTQGGADFVKKNFALLYGGLFAKRKNKGFVRQMYLDDRSDPDVWDAMQIMPDFLANPLEEAQMDAREELVRANLGDIILRTIDKYSALDNLVTREAGIFIGKGFNYFSDTYTMFMNRVRIYQYKMFLAQVPYANAEQKRAVLVDIMNFTGRGVPEGVVENFFVGEGSAKILSAPRLYLSRYKVLKNALTLPFQLGLNAIDYARGDVKSTTEINPETGQHYSLDGVDFAGLQRLKQYASIGIGMVMAKALLESLGWEWEDDYKDKNFLRFKQEDKVIDISGGMQVFMKIPAFAYYNSVAAGSQQEADERFGKVKASQRSSLTNRTVMGDMLKALRYKLHPSIGLAMQAITGKDAIGQSFGITGDQRMKNVVKSILPISVQAATDLFQMGRVRLDVENDPDYVQLFTYLGLSEINYENAIEDVRLVNYADQIKWRNNKKEEKVGYDIGMLITAREASKYLVGVGSEKGYEDIVKSLKKEALLSAFKSHAQNLLGEWALVELDAGRKPTVEQFRRKSKVIAQEMGKLYYGHYVRGSDDFEFIK